MCNLYPHESTLKGIHMYKSILKSVKVYRKIHGILQWLSLSKKRVTSLYIKTAVTPTCASNLEKCLSFSEVQYKTENNI